MLISTFSFKARCRRFGFFFFSKIMIQQEYFHTECRIFYSFAAKADFSDLLHCKQTKIQANNHKKATYSKLPSGRWVVAHGWLGSLTRITFLILLLAFFSQDGSEQKVTFTCGGKTGRLGRNELESQARSADSSGFINVTIKSELGAPLNRQRIGSVHHGCIAHPGKSRTKSV